MSLSLSLYIYILLKVWILGDDFLKSPDVAGMLEDRAGSPGPLLLGEDLGEISLYLFIGSGRNTREKSSRIQGEGMGIFRCPL